MNAIIPASPTPFDVSAIDRAALASSTKAQYRKAITNMMEAGVNPADHSALQSYADGLKSSSRQFLKSAIRLMTLGYEQDIKSSATPENIGIAQAAVMRLEAMRGAVKVPTHKGTKAHTWLSTSQVIHITALCGDSLEGKRDWIVLGLLLGAGLRCAELAALTFDALKVQPTKNGERVVVEVLGKGNKYRTVPINSKLAFRLAEWRALVGPGSIARAITRGGNLTDSISSRGIFELVGRYGEKIGISGLAPHDCRRTYAQLGYEAGIPITQISTLLGHANVATTQRYLNLALDLESTASDFIPLS